MAIGTSHTTLSNKHLQFQWVLPLFLRPKHTIAEIVAQEKKIWLTPLLILSILVVLATLIGGPIRRMQIETNATLPPDFEYYSPEMQDQYFQAQGKQTSPVILYVFPVLTGILKYWISWFLLGSLLHLSLTLAGSRAATVKSMNLAGWSFLPFALRFVVQILSMLFSKSLVNNPGFSGFISSEVGGMGAYARAFVGLIDIYFIFQVVILLLGALSLSGLTRTKAWGATIVSVIILLLLQSVPGFLSSLLGGLSSSGNFFYF